MAIGCTSRAPHCTYSIARLLQTVNRGEKATHPISVDQTSNWPYNKNMDNTERKMKDIDLQDLELIAAEVNEFEQWMSKDELLEYQEEYNAWVDEQWAIEEARRGLVY